MFLKFITSNEEARGRYHGFKDLHISSKTCTSNLIEFSTFLTLIWHIYRDRISTFSKIHTFPFLPTTHVYIFQLRSRDFNKVVDHENHKMNANTDEKRTVRRMIGPFSDHDFVGLQ